MKRGLVVLLIIALFSGCVTNPIRQDPHPMRRPLSPGWAAVAGLLPGLPQLLNGEYLEALIYCAGTFIPAYIGSAMAPAEPWAPADYPAAYGVTAAGGVMYIVGYVDGIFTSSVRTTQCRKIAPELFVSPRQAWINAKRLQVGMTASDVRSILGQPDDVRTSIGSWGTHEQWIYRGYEGFGDEVYVYIENGMLRSWQLE